jgi:hypothetical protein
MLVADDRKPAILHRQILAMHSSDVVGIVPSEIPRFPVLATPSLVFGSMRRDSCIRYEFEGLAELKTRAFSVDARLAGETCCEAFCKSEALFSFL